MRPVGSHGHKTVAATEAVVDRRCGGIRHPPLASTLRQHGSFEVRRLSWNDAARTCVGVYEQALGMMNGKR